jgi:hypothetical protein
LYKLCDAGVAVALVAITITIDGMTALLSGCGTPPFMSAASRSVDQGRRSSSRNKIPSLWPIRP